MELTVSVDGSVHHSGSTPETLTELVLAQVRLLRTLLGTIADLDRALGAGLVGHAKAKLLAPMPLIGEVNLAQPGSTDPRLRSLFL